jgi:HSP20 family molecular chaperone IbpA
VTLDYPVLSISGEMSSEDTHENTATHQSQSFSEKIHLRKEVEREATTAEYKNGILTITLPYTEETSGTEISIE